jgi:hypothetical protein
MSQSWASKQVDRYRVFFNPGVSYPGRILLDVRPVGGGIYWIWFTNSDPLPASTIDETAGSAFYPYKMYQSVVDALRQESPIYLIVNPDSDRLYLSTATEPPGEGPVDSDFGGP